MGTPAIPEESSYSRVMQHLAHGESDADKALGALTIALMCEEGKIPSNSTTVSKMRECLFNVLSDGAEEVKVNAFLAIASLTNASESFTSGVTAENVSTLVQSIPKDLNTSSPEEAAKTAINGLGCIAAFARLDESIYEPLARTLLDNNAISTALQFVNSPMPTLRAAACEAMCALSSNNLVDFKTVSVTQGATTSLMSSVTRHANEVAHMHANVLSLLGIGMLLQMDEQAQECIASSSLDIGLLLGFMRQHDDGDVQVLATDIFGVLVRKHKDKVAESMRYAQKSMDANLQYTR